MAEQRDIDPDRIRALVHDAVRGGAETVEDVHQYIAGLPFDVLSRVSGLEEQADAARSVTKRSIGFVYDLIHTVNDQASTLAERIIAEARDAAD